MNYPVTLLAALCLGVSIFNAALGEDVRKIRTEFQQRQLEINENAGYKQLNEKMINALANVAANTGDEAIREMLSGEGVTFTMNQAAQPAQAAPAATEGGQGNE